MFVPLERLYGFLNHYVDDDVIIYHFRPHGSRKFSDVCRLKDDEPAQNWLSKCKSIPMLMHDQESLLLNHKQDDDLEQICSFLQHNHRGVYAGLDQFDLLPDLAQLPSYRNKFDWFYRLYTTDRWLLCHSEKNSPVLGNFESLGAIGVYWWIHAMISRDWYRYAQIDPNLNFFDRQFVKDFNIYNRAWSGSREYRLKFAEMVLHNDLLPHASMTLSEHDHGTHYSEHRFQNPKFAVSQPLTGFATNRTGADASADYCANDYQQAAIDVVLETLFDDTRIHLTEKTLRPIACGKPFVLIATPGCLEYLKDYGFQTFASCIDETYDRITDPLDRLQAVIKVMKGIAALPSTSKTKLFAELHRIASINREWFWSDRFARKILEEFVANYKKSYHICKNSPQGQDWIQWRKELCDVNPAYRNFLTSSNCVRSRQDIKQLLCAIKASQR